MCRPACSPRPRRSSSCVISPPNSCPSPASIITGRSARVSPRWCSAPGRPSSRWWPSANDSRRCRAASSVPGPRTSRRRRCGCGFPRLEWHALARTVFLPADPRPSPTGRGTVLVVCAGTSDLPVAEEAAVVAEAFGNRVDRIADVGVAGLHRLMAQSERLREAAVVIVVAGMEGALAERRGRPGRRARHRGADQRRVRRRPSAASRRCSACSTAARRGSRW